MAHMFLGWPNLVDRAALSGGSWRESLPLSYLLVRSHSALARSTDASTESTAIQLAFAEPVSIRAVALANHNLSINATARVMAGASPGGSDIHDSEPLDAWSIAFGESPEWDQYNWQQQIAVDEYIGSPFPCIYVADEAFTTQHLRIEIDDDTNAAGYVQIGRLFVGGGFVPEINPQYGMSDSFYERSEIIDLESGGIAAWARRQRRTTRLELAYMTQDEEFPIVHEIIRRVSTHGEILYVPDIEDPVESQRTGFIGRIARINPIGYPLFGRRSVTLDLVEVV